MTPGSPRSITSSRGTNSRRRENLNPVGIVENVRLMARDEEKEVRVRELVEYGGFKTFAAVSVFLQKLGKGIDDVEQVVSNVNTGFSILLDTGRTVVGALNRPRIDAEMDYHRRQLELLEEKKKRNL